MNLGSISVGALWSSRFWLPHPFISLEELAGFPNNYGVPLFVYEDS
jgi:hypothetical protein